MIQSNMDTFDHLSEMSLSFSKVFTYERVSEWILPPVKDVFTTENVQDSELMEQKSSLNELKSSLNGFDIKIWNKHTNFVNPAGKILQTVRREIGPELPTQAWCKFHEILSYAEVIPTNCNGTIFTLHLCEAPGGFICSLNHYLKSRRAYKGIRLQWVANALNPYYEGNSLDHCILDDRLICSTLKSWYFGKDNTGNIMQPDFIDGLQSHCNKNFKQKYVSIVTADGSFNCQNQPAEQETVVAHLKYTEMFTALHFLACGGTFVMKIFTLFEHHSICLMYILCCWFKSVSVTKPASSKAGNSEVYVVARDFCGPDESEEFLKKLQEFHPFQSVIKECRAMIPFDSIPKSFLQQHVECTKMFAAHQKAAINRNLHYYSHRSRNDTSAVKDLQHIFTQRYFDLCELRRLTRKLFIVKSPVMKSHLKQTPRLEGAFGQRVTPLSMDHADNDRSQRAAVAVKDIRFLSVPADCFSLDHVCLTEGQQLTDIKSSLYCTTDVIFRYLFAYRAVMSKDTTLLEQMSFDESWTPGGSFSDNLKKLLTKDAESIVELEALPDAKHFGQHFKDAFISCDSDLTLYQTFSLVNFTAGCGNDVPVKTIVSFLIQSGYTDWPELPLRSTILQVIVAVMKSLCNEGICLIVLPSVLTRLISQALCFLCQYFSEVSLQPCCLAPFPPFVLFVGKCFHSQDNSMTDRFLNLLEDAVRKLESGENVDALEFFPATSLLASEDDASCQGFNEQFAYSLKQANEYCIERITAKFEDLLKL